MVILKLTLLTLLIATLGLHASEAITVTCEGNSAVLNCGLYRITIISAFYGRTDTTTCTENQPWTSIRNTNCFTPNAQYIVKSRCDGLHNCHVPATNYLFSDPCYGTYKYMTIAYTCR
ncbi:rhamnose-binding lectin-like [Clarias gariepinus]|uniref:rhamnose-binding lectin-like n=1 Tax=Clarias gariepinus TaxID=13013 RepID=UPI00234E1597|nr:rhamnose-binding lectin-like [Clarias gariepinus]